MVSATSSNAQGGQARLLAASPSAGSRSQSEREPDVEDLGALPSDRDLGELMSDLVVGLTLFLSSYAPLFAILALRFDRRWLSLTCGALAVLGVIAAVVLIRRYRGVSGQRWPLQTVEDRGSEVAGYLGLLVTWG
jgi:hypothetical protein